LRKGGRNPEKGRSQEGVPLETQKNHTHKSERKKRRARTQGNEMEQIGKYLGSKGGRIWHSEPKAAHPLGASGK